MIGHGGVDLGLRGSPGTDHYDYVVITVIRSRQLLSDRGERQRLYSI